MIPTVLSTATLLLAASSAVDAGPVGICTQLTYADGGIYCRETPSGACLGDLGDFPARVSFRWEVEYSFTLTIPLLRSTSPHHYIRYPDRLYIDTSPGSFAPLRFTRDNTTLSPGETSWAWVAGNAIPLWTPTGRMEDGLPEDPEEGSGGGVDAGQGWEFVDVDGYEGLKRVWWNQSRFEDMRAGRGKGTVLGWCYGDYSPVFEDVDGPVE